MMNVLSLQSLAIDKGEDSNGLTASSESNVCSSWSTSGC